MIDLTQKQLEELAVIARKEGHSICPDCENWRREFGPIVALALLTEVVQLRARLAEHERRKEVKNEKAD